MYGKPAVGRKTNAGWCESISRRATESSSINGRSGGTTERRNDSDRFFAWATARGLVRGGRRAENERAIIRICCDGKLSQQTRVLGGKNERGMVFPVVRVRVTARGAIESGIGSRAVRGQPCSDRKTMWPQQCGQSGGKTSRAVFVDRSHAANARELLHAGNCAWRFVRSNCRRTFERR